MITLKSKREIKGMYEAGQILAELYLKLNKFIKPGITGLDIEDFATSFFTKKHVIPEEKGFEGYKYATCVSINDEVCHGTPRNIRLKNGDLVKVDTVISLNGYISDSCWAFAVGDVSSKVKKLMQVTKKALYLGIDQAVIGNRIGDIGYAIQHYVEDEMGYGDVREYVGHGIQPTMHEDPMVPAYGDKHKGLRLKEGMTLTIEPMVNIGDWHCAPADERDGWTVRTLDGSLSCQYEHTIAVTKDGPKILTSQNHEEDAKYL
ncbi:MAG: type I methionyl aminopeptidase [Firmicutes bacterium]|uniref:Methionine aminopeptidase n=1 Tax=Candidatus Gallilactobacillus intestinavium TaxID=2840838 RepID=A0A9D9H4S2_9LACO|nr:type I methionyl aminopeptidase [Candidatus Gallilactobacillus intestinavium]